MPRVTSPVAAKLPADFESLVRMLPPCAISDEVAYRNSQEMIDALTCIEKMSPGQAQYLETLTILLADYEDQHHAIDASDIGPIEVLRALMEGHGMSASKLGEMLGERSLGSKILNGGRKLSKAHIRTLADHFKVSADLFL